MEGVGGNRPQRDQLRKHKVAVNLEGIGSRSGSKRVGARMGSRAVRVGSEKERVGGGQQEALE